jgi:Mycobacterium phage DNA polymerase exonuclease subunit
MKILFFDIESAGVNALKSDLGFVIVFGYKWAHEKQAHSLVLDEKDLKNFSDKKLLIEASKLFNEADLIVGHFASVFDIRFIQGRLLINKLPPIYRAKLRDTCMIARSAANFSSNRLKHLANILSLRHKKTENNWPTAWFKAMQGDVKALKGLSIYCRNDVLALEELYYRLRPFDSYPRVVLNRNNCGACGSVVAYRGFTFVEQKKYRRYVCTNCGRWGRNDKPEKKREVIKVK